MAKQFGFDSDSRREDETAGGKIVEDLDFDATPDDDFASWMALESIEITAAGGDLKLKKKLNRMPVVNVWIMYYYNLSKRRMI